LAEKGRAQCVKQLWEGRGEEMTGGSERQKQLAGQRVSDPVTSSPPLLEGNEKSL